MADAVLLDHYSRMLRAGFETATNEGEAISAELDAEALRSLLTSAARMAETMDHSILDAPWLRNDLTRIVDDWMSAPGDVLKLSDLRDSLEPLFGPSRALMIARTETAGAFNGGLAAGLRAHGWTDVVWIAADDACAECAELDGTVMTLGEYEADPTLHPNCSCTAEPYVEEGEEGGEAEEAEA